MMLKDEQNANSGLIARQEMRVGDCFTRVWKRYARLSLASDPMFAGVCGRPIKKGDKIWGFVDPEFVKEQLKTMATKKPAPKGGKKATKKGGK
jgi:hypothetical protein